ncbi:MAG: hypothetical protein LC772_08140 [Chloroflexi bacterium]|nr:hypothetical protein [Chloroflexota bacterium]
MDTVQAGGLTFCVHCNYSDLSWRNHCYTAEWRRGYAMQNSPDSWVLLIYRIPSQPTRLRLQIWRRLQRMGVVYLQDAVCLLPARPDLVENMHYIVEAVEEMGGSCHLFSASSLLPGEDERLHQEFRSQADTQMDQIVQRLTALRSELESAATLPELEQAEDALKRERVSYLRARRLAFFGSPRSAEVDHHLDSLRAALDSLHRMDK